VIEPVIIGRATLYNADCRDVLPLLGNVDAVVTDPPYGINVRARVNHPEAADWDGVIADLIPWLAIGRHHVFWGAQYYAHQLPLSEAWACWVKRPLEGINKRQTHTTIELAWTDHGKPRFHAQVWDGGKREGCADNRLFCHPAQKPVELMAWCIANLPESANVICDPFAGSGTTGVAAVQAGKSFIGIERDPEHFNTACKRIRQAQNQGLLFGEAA
jgi:site-specific DNA-methyltransferase (adenine-specific)